MKFIRIREHERGLKFVDEKFKGILRPGKYTVLPFSKVNIEVFSVRDIELTHEKLEFIAKANLPGSELLVTRINEGERGLLVINGLELKFLEPGLYAHWKVFEAVEVINYKMGKLFAHPEIERMYRNQDKFPELEFLDIPDGGRASITVNGHLYGMVGSGIVALWKEGNDIVFERFETDEVFFQNRKLSEILKHPASGTFLEKVEVPVGFKALVTVDGKMSKEFGQGLFAYWKNIRKVEVTMVDLREKTLEITGQEIMTADKVTLRVNALVTFTVVNPTKAIQEFQDFESALYKETQMALRSTIGGKELDPLLSEKGALETDVRSQISTSAGRMGLEVRNFGLKDIILPGDMKELLNKVTEAKKASEAALITRREETASMRSQANTAKILESNPTLMRIRELETLEKVAQTASLKIVLGERGLTESITKLI
ncbi:MAG: SPFH domain-containing protein [Lentisphaeraceae bacterium]|nr:SPFH domain-containing protein [Lentisphaeraceae bacterium]